MPPKKQNFIQVNEDSASYRKYNLRQNKKGKQATKNNARDKKSYTEDEMDLPEGIYDANANSSKSPESINKDTFKKNIIEEHSPSNSPHDSDNDLEELIDEVSEEFDESYFDPVPYEEPKNEKEAKKYEQKSKK